MREVWEVTVNSEVEKVAINMVAFEATFRVLKNFLIPQK